MDLNLTLGYQEQNDNKAVILTDTTNNYNSVLATNLVSGDALVDQVLYEIVTQGTLDFAATYGAVDNNVGTRFVADVAVPINLGAGDELKTVTPTVEEITALTLDTVFTGVSGTATNLAQIDLIAEFGAAAPPYFTDQSQMVFTITSDLWGTGTDALLEDGLYDLTYNVTYQPTGSDNPKTETLEVVILVYGQVKVAVYDKYRQIPAWCNCKDDEALHSILETDLCGAYLIAIENSAYLAKTEELINMLIVLDDMVKDGSKIYY